MMYSYFLQNCKYFEATKDENILYRVDKFVLLLTLNYICLVYIILKKVMMFSLRI